MSDHQGVDRERVFVVEKQVIRIEDVFGADDLILDLGGGGEGVIGQLRERQVVAVDKRKDELQECADGPIKVIADACALPFLDESFDAATAFFFLMYVPQGDRRAVLDEAFRVVRPAGVFHVWDATIPPRGDHRQDAFCVFVEARLPDRTVATGYGVPWADHELSAATVVELGRDAGFRVSDVAGNSSAFHVVFNRP